MISLRPYQEEAIQSVMDFWAAGGGNPLVDLATGLGKSIVIAEMTRRLLTEWPDMRVLMLVHVKELVQQNAMALMRLWPEAPVGINSAGLGRRDLHSRVLFASVQSVFRRPETLGKRDLVLIDESHLVPLGGDGMYRTLLEGLREQTPDLRVVGFTATPYRMDSGRLDQGPYRLFDEVVYSYGIRDGIEAGFLSPLISKPTGAEIDVSGVHVKGGEFVAGELEAAASTPAVVEAAVDEIVLRGQDRRAWLAFCSGVGHALHVRDAIRRRGVSCETVTGETPSGERDRIIREFKAGRIRCLTNANVLTTGFDAPMTDMLAMLRPTLSTGLYVQMVGRGTRLAEGKANCLVLDFAGVVRRHGPVDAVKPKRQSLGGQMEVKVKPDTVRAKACPECESYVPVSQFTCDDCGYEWPKPDAARHADHADIEVEILSSKAPEKKIESDWLTVRDTLFERHEKPGSPPSLRCEHLAGPRTYREWLCFEHAGGARDRARSIWRQLGGNLPAPSTIDEAISRLPELNPITAIRVKKNGKYTEVVGHRCTSGSQLSEAAE